MTRNIRRLIKVARKAIGTFFNPETIVPRWVENLWGFVAVAVAMSILFVSLPDRPNLAMLGMLGAVVVYLPLLIKAHFQVREAVRAGRLYVSGGRCCPVPESRREEFASKYK